LKATRKKESHKRRNDVQAEQQALAHLRAQIRGREDVPAHAKSSVPTKTVIATAAADARFDAKRNELRARFRDALKTRTRKSDRGND